jgi:hypothetical protein
METIRSSETLLGVTTQKTTIYIFAVRTLISGRTTEIFYMDMRCDVLMAKKLSNVVFSVVSAYSFVGDHIRFGGK